jgi:hypothetical protein
MVDSSTALAILHGEVIRKKHHPETVCTICTIQLATQRNLKRIIFPTWAGCGIPNAAA